MQSKCLMAVTGLLSATAIVLSACGTAAGSGGSESAHSGDNVIRIEYVHRLPDGPGMIPVVDMVEKWNAAHPNIQVTATKFTGKSSELMTKLKTDVANKSAPCLAQVGYAEIPKLYASGLLTDVSSQAEKYKEHFSEGSMSLMTVGKTVVGLPQDSGPLVYFYNKAAFDQLGLKVPTTSAELAEVAKKAAEQGKYALAFEPDEAPNTLAGQAAAAGAQWFSAENDKWKVNVSSPETAKVSSFWQGVLDSKSALVANRWDDAFGKALVDQQLIGTIGAAWEGALLADTMKDSPNAGSWAVAQLPAFGDKAMSGPDGGSGVAVLKGCSNPEGAMAFNDWFNTQVDDLATQGLVLTAKAPVKTPQTISTFFGGQDVYAEFTKANAAVNSKFGFMPTWPSLADPMTKAAEAAGKGTGKVDDIFQAAQKTSVSSLKDANLPVAE